ncbi:MAG TPA: hypothetical protein PK170_09965 [Anaerolineae bacterium]|nr:hypothetical protein [Anaerolineae bacterium]
MTSVTLELPTNMYQQAAQLARATQRPIEQVVMEWIRPPMAAAGAAEETLRGLEDLSDRELNEVARSKTARQEAERLQTLLAWQQQRALTYAEREEANLLVAREELLTLRKAKAIYLLKQRNALPRDLAA